MLKIGFKRINLIFLIFCILVTGIGLFIACESKVSANVEVKVVLVGYYENELFQEGADANAVKSGYAYEYYRKLSEYTGWEYEYVYGTYSDLYEKLLNGDIDVLAGLAKTEDREGKIYYPDNPMGSEVYNIIKHDYDTDVTSDPTSYYNKKIGILNSAIVTAFTSYLDNYGLSADITLFDDYESLYNAFNNGEIDIAAVEGSGSYGRENIEVVSSFGSSDFYLCVSYDRPDLLKKLNEAQSEISIQEPNFLSNLKTKYYSGSVSSYAFSESEKEWLKQHNTLNVGYLENLLPLCDIDENGDVTGVIKDLVPEIFNLLSISYVEINYQGYSSYDDMMEDITNGKIDLAFPVDGSLFYSEENGINQSSAVISVSNELVYNEKNGSENINTIAVNKNNKLQYYCAILDFPDKEIVYYDSIEECLEAVKKGDVEITILNGLRTYHILKNGKYHSLSAMPLSRKDDICFGIKIGNDGLLRLINRGISVLDDNYIQSNAVRYAEELYKYTIQDFISDNISWIIGLLLIVFLIIIIAVMIGAKSKIKKAKKQRLTIQNVFNQMIRAMAKIIDKKDEYTRGHSFRVAIYSRKLALKIGYSIEMAEKIYNVALLHDIGKIFVPNDILHKPRDLSDDEYKTVKLHTSYGKEILQEIDSIPEIAYGAGYHHERYDGKGYPEGLMKDEIPEIAQIISVADAFDAMYSTRPYRRQMNLYDCLAEIENGAGTQFNPDFAHAFVEMVREDGLDGDDDVKNDILWW